MRMLRPVILPKLLLMPTGQSETPKRRGVGAELVGDQQFRRETLLLEQLAHQPQPRTGVASALDQHVEDLALVIDGTPQIHALAGDAHYQLVEMPAVARPRATLAQPSRDRGTELQHPAPHRFVGDIEPSFGQQFLDIAVAQGEVEIEPDRVLDDLGREAMAAVADRNHAHILPDMPLAPDPVSVTMPYWPFRFQAAVDDRPNHPVPCLHSAGTERTDANRLEGPPRRAQPGAGAEFES